MNLENIVRAMVVKRKLNIEKVKKSSTLFKIFVTDYETGLSKYFCNHDDVDLIQAIKATCAYPGFHTPIEVQGRRYLDGYVRKMIPINDAIKDGCTDVLIITATPQDYIRADGWLFRFVLATALIPLNRKFKKAYNRMFKEEQLELKEAFGEAKLIKKINIFTISPDYLINNAEIRPSVLERYGRHGIKVAREVFCRLRIRV
jgi:predicted patatin/cPLA2 family phospholipase